MLQVVEKLRGKGVTVSAKDDSLRDNLEFQIAMGNACVSDVKVREDDGTQRSLSVKEREEFVAFTPGVADMIYKWAVDLGAEMTRDRKVEQGN